MKISIVFLGTTGAGPVYSLEMAKALSERCNMQVILSDQVKNIEAWRMAFDNTNVELQVVKAYQHTKTSVFFSFFNYQRKDYIAKLITLFNPDVLYVPFGLMWARYIYANIPKRTIIISTIHDVEFHDKFNIGDVFMKILTYGSDRYVDGYVILNKREKEIVQKRYKKPVAVIPHASFDYYFKKESHDKSLKKTIGFFGRIEPYKGLDLLIAAFKKTRTLGLKLIIAGNGSIDKQLKEEIESCESISLINRYINDDEFQPLLDKVDFVVLPYKRASQSGVIPMCFAYGKTVVATNVGALSEQVPEGTGIITNPVSDDIARNIDYLYSDPGIIFEYGASAQKYAEEELSWTHSAELLISFITEIV